MSAASRLLLVGGGHAHLGLLAAASRLPGPLQITLVDARPEAIYSGMVPGAVAGHHAPADCMIDLAAAARRAGARFIQARATALDAQARQVRLEDGRLLDYDLLGLDVGGAPSDDGRADASPAAGPRWLDCRPFTPLLAALPDIDRRAAGEGLRIAVAGAGLAGIELALALAWRMRHCPRAGVELLCAADGPAPQLPAHARHALAAACAQAGVTMITHARVRRGTGDDRLRLEDGRHVHADLVLACTGAAPPAWLAGSGLALDAQGYVSVDTGLASRSHPEVYASGDCASVLGHPRPRAGVYAVRHGLRLAASLARHLRGQPTRGHPPQRLALALVGLGPPRAMALRGTWSFGGPAGPGEPPGRIAELAAAVLWRWKRHLDRRFVQRHR